MAVSHVSKVIIFYSVYLIIVAAPSYLIGILIKKLFNIPDKLIRIMKYITFSSASVLAIYVIIFRSDIVWTILMPLVGLLGLALGFWLSFAKKRKRME